MRKWLGNWLVRIMRQSQEDESVPALNSVTKVSRAHVDMDDGLNITVRNAIGGRIVSFRHYNHKTDQNTYKVYIVPEDQDFERELGKMITLESMRAT